MFNIVLAGVCIGLAGVEVDWPDKPTRLNGLVVDSYSRPVAGAEVWEWAAPAAQSLKMVTKPICF